MPNVANLFAQCAHVLAWRKSRRTDDNVNRDAIKLWETRIDWLLANHMPHGSGFDSDTLFLVGESSSRTLVFMTEFHHMNDVGMYTKWTKHRVVVKADLIYGFNIRVSGQNHNGIKEYIADTFHTALRAEIEFPITM